MRALVFGAGFLGERIARTLGAVVTTVRIHDPVAVDDAIAAARPDVVINAAGKTGCPNVDWCETHPLETALSNTTGPLVLAAACADARVHLVHLGSGCVFYGRSPHADGAWRENDHANPSSIYSRTKYAADLALSRLRGVAIVRLRMPVGSSPHPRNLITKLAGYQQVIDVENSVTVVDDLVEVVRAIAERRAEGVFHAVNPGTVRHRDILALYREMVDPAHRCELISEADLVLRGLAVAMRSNCVLANTRLDAWGVHMRPVDEALRAVMAQYAINAGIAR